jgi:outer membrane protein assembly factor BamB
MQHRATIDPSGLDWLARCGGGIGRSISWLGVGFLSVGLSLASAQPLAIPRESDTPGSVVRRPGLDRYDLRAAEDMGRSEKLTLVRKSFERQRWDEGVLQLQTLLSDEQDSLVFGEDRRWRPVSQVVVDMIRQAPPEALRAYDARYQAIAERDLKLAQQTRDLPGLSRVARRYLLTTSGQLACRELIDAASDQGNCDAIAQLVADLLRVVSPQLNDDVWRRQLLDLLSESGHLSLVKRLADHAGVPVQSVVTASPWSLARFRASHLPITEWTTLGGGPSGQSVAHLQETSLLPRWRVPLVAQPRIRQLLREQRLDFDDDGALGLSLLSTVGSGDVLVTRTLSDLTAVDARTGQTLWQSREWGPRPSVAEEPPFNLDPPSLDSSNLDRETHFLGYRIRQRMTTCGSLGALSADARRIYSLTYFPTEESPLEEVVQPGFENDEGGTITLQARDLHSGRILWRAGGPPAEEPPGLPAAGVFFFGPPIPDGEELFAVGEREGDILLFCLEAETGLVRWEQLLAATGHRIVDDAARMSWAAPVAVRGSLVVCPTTTGWLTVVDRVSQKIRWAVRMVPRAPVNPDATVDIFDNPDGDGSNRDGGLDERWPPLQPILLRDRVIVAPIEFPDERGDATAKLLCYDLDSGEMLWELDKVDQVGVVGATEELVYLFDRHSICGIKTSTGVPGWTCPIDEQIAGRPLLTPSGIVVPTRAGTLVRVDSTSGLMIESLRVGEVPIRERMVARLMSPDDPQALSLGNLISLGGRLISVSDLDMTAFEWQADEARWQAEAPTNADSSLRWARSQALRGQFADAARTLRESAALAANSPAQATRQRQSLLAVLFLQLETELPGTSSATDRLGRLHELQSLATSPEDREAVQRLGIELALQAGEWDSAWSQIREALRQPLTFTVEHENHSVCPEAWLADRILTLARIPDRTPCDALRAAIREEFQVLWTAAAQDRAGRERLLRVFAETPFVDRAEFESLTTPDDPTTLTRLQALTLSRDRNVADLATLRLIERLATPDWVGEARRRLALWMPTADWPEELRAARQELEKTLSGIVDAHRVPHPSWLGQPIEVQRRGGESSEYGEDEFPLLWIGEPCEALENFHYRYDETLQCVAIERADGSRYGELLLATTAEDQNDQTSPILYGSGLNIYLVHQGVIHAFSIPEKRLLWHRQTDSDSDYERGYNADESDRWQLHPPHSLNTESASFGNSRTVFEVANSRHLVARTRRGIEVLSAIDGQVVWSIPRCLQSAVRCDEDRLYRRYDLQSEACSIRSGRPIQAPDLAKTFMMLTPLHPQGLTTLHSPQPIDSRNWRLEQFRFTAERITGRTDTEAHRWDEQDLLKLESVWTQPLAEDCLLGAGPPGQGLWIEKSGAVHVIEWATGLQHDLGTAILNDEVVQAARARDVEVQVFACWDRSQLLIATNFSDNQGDAQCPYIPVHGVLSVHSRDRSLSDWHASLNGVLLTQSLDQSPILPILHLEEFRVKDINAQRMHLMLLDKQTGKVVYELKTPTLGSGAFNYQFEPHLQRLRLSLPDEQLRVQPRAVPPP